MLLGELASYFCWLQCIGLSANAAQLVNQSAAVGNNKRAAIGESRLPLTGPFSSKTKKSFLNLLWGLTPRGTGVTEAVVAVCARACLCTILSRCHTVQQHDGKYRIAESSARMAGCILFTSIYRIGTRRACPVNGSSHYASSRRNWLACRCLSPSTPP